MVTKLWKLVLTEFGLTLLCAVTLAAPKASSMRTEDLEIKSYRVQSLVVSRYAFTTIICKIINPSALQREALFSVLLPVDAFISNLTIEAGGYNYTSMVQEKEEAKRTYEEAKIKGNNAAIVHQKERETSRFRVDVSIAAQDEVIFYLSYEELLVRSLGRYTLRINVHPNYIVRDVTVDVTIHETRDISLLKAVKVPGGDQFISAMSEWREGNKTARLQFDPDPASLPSDVPLHGQLVIEYDTKRALDAGDVQIEDGYFVHFFAPVELQHTPKYITFLIDNSGSMSGMKLEQVKDALKRILIDLNKGDFFSIIKFSDGATTLIDSKFSPGAVKETISIIEGLESDAGTNIDLALKVALSSEAKENEEVMSHIIVLLTDGKATMGVHTRERILKNARERNKSKATIFCLGFGQNADMNLLQKLALQNGGFARKIYVDIDAADQLEHFYKALSTPLLLDIRFSYSDADINTNAVTNTNFYNYFMGTELVIAGQMQKNHRGGIRASITGQGRNGEFTMGVTEFNTVTPPDWSLLDHLHLSPTPRKFIKRLWAFLMVKELLNKEKAAVEKRERIVSRQRALHLALQYHFVTPLTSLVVVQPDSQRCKDYDDDYDDQESTTDEPFDDTEDELDTVGIDPLGEEDPTVDVEDEGTGLQSVDEDLNAGSMTTFSLSPKVIGYSALEEEYHMVDNNIPNTHAGILSYSYAHALAPPRWIFGVLFVLSSIQCFLCKELKT